MASFTTLPIELCSQIFSHLEFDDLWQCLFVCKYFYQTLRYGPGAVASINLQNGNLALVKQIKFFLNVITNQSQRKVKSIRIDSYRMGLVCGDGRSYYDSIGWLMSDYKIDTLDLCLRGDGILNVIERLGPFDSLRQLRFGLGGGLSLDLNGLQVLADMTPNLETLKIDAFNGLHIAPYTGKKVFEKLTSLRIFTGTKHIRYGWRILFSRDDIVSSFLLKTPNLTHLALMGEFFEQPMNPSLNFIESLKSLTSLGIQIPDPYDHKLPPIKEIGVKLTELCIKIDEVYKLSPQADRLTNVETLYFDGLGCNYAMEYYGIGDNLKRLFLKPISIIMSTYSAELDKVSDICKKCPQLEQLVVYRFAVPVSWLVEIANVYCQKLSLVYLDLVCEESGYNIDLMKSVRKLWDIYLPNRLPESEVAVLHNHGFNVYNGYDWSCMFDQGPFGNDNWFMW